MRVEGSRRLNGSIAVILGVMIDPEILARCIPGCKELRETEPGKYRYNLLWGYKGRMQVGKVSSPSRIGRCLILIFSSFLNVLKSLHPKILAIFKGWCFSLISKGFIKQFPSFLSSLRGEVVMEGSGVNGSLKLTGIVDIEQQADYVLVKYKGDFYLGGPAAMLQMGHSSIGGLDPEKFIDSFLENIESELSARTGDRTSVQEES